MKIFKTAAVLASAAALACALTEKEEKTVTDVLAVLKRGTSIYPLEDLMHQLANSLGFTKSAAKLNRFVPNGTAAYATVYDMLIYVDANGKHSPEQHEKLRQLTEIIGSKVLKLNEKQYSLHTLVVQEEEEDASSVKDSKFNNMGDFNRDFIRMVQTK
ncbi:hypothetical protein IW150_003943 [Coemansia sp. RSA 2607]|nr:hypothetical protein IW150_003943 [Coemansia sp. RSA 2607]KAJ2386778.1 hypothetical protein GGI05_004279 [Coemansia sp. RSA 2603]